MLMYACRAYELLKQQREEEQAAQEVEEALLDLLRAELEAERSRRAAEERKRRQEELRREMVQANDCQRRLKASSCSGGIGRDQRWRPLVHAAALISDQDTGCMLHALRLSIPHPHVCVCAPTPALLSSPACRPHARLRSVPTRRSSGGACWSGLLRRTAWSR